MLTKRFTNMVVDAKEPDSLTKGDMLVIFFTGIC